MNERLGARAPVHASASSASSESGESLAERLAREAIALGFARVGFAEATRLDRESAALEAWLARGDHATMDWMARTAEVRADVRHENMLAGARTVVVVAAPYGGDEPLDLGPGRLARYARGRDYHRVLDKRLRALASVLVEAGHRARPAIDTKPVFERAYAERAGVGFVGKNACIIVPGIGSHVFLGCVVTDAELPPSIPVREGCGSCTRCLDACPTGAFRAPRVLDSRRCVAYLTIEHEGPVDAELTPGVGDWLFGCDACQDPCPYNAGRARSVAYDAAFASHARFEAVDVESFLRMDDAAFDRFSEGSPLRRTGRIGMARNAAIVLGNRADRRHLPLLDETAAHHDSDVVRDAARAARDRLATRHPEGVDQPSSGSADASSD